jgi:hypothetical protein
MRAVIVFPRNASLTIGNANSAEWVHALHHIVPWDEALGF